MGGIMGSGLGSKVQSRLLQKIIGQNPLQFKIRLQINANNGSRTAAQSHILQERNWECGRRNGAGKNASILRGATQCCNPISTTYTRRSQECTDNAKKKKNKKASSVDGVPAELLKARSMRIATKLHEFISTIWSNAVIPED